MTRDQIIETLARAFARKYGGLGKTMEADFERVEKTWRRYADEMETALSAIEAAGLVVVPVRPTEEMISALQSYAVCAGYIEEGYAAMIKAAQEKTK